MSDDSMVLVAGARAAAVHDLLRALFTHADECAAWPAVVRERFG